MAVDYSLVCINARLQAVVDTIGASGNGFIVLMDGPTTLVTIQLANPCGTVSGGVLTFGGTMLDTATGTGVADVCNVTDALGVDVITGLTVGIPFSGAEVIISNGLNSTAIASGQAVQVLSAEITGS
jgi:hypothetical protein